MDVFPTFRELRAHALKLELGRDDLRVIARVHNTAAVILAPTSAGCTFENTPIMSNIGLLITNT